MPTTQALKQEPEELTAHSAGAAPDALQDAPVDEIIRRALEAAREMLGMDMAYLADTRAGLQDYRTITGAGESFGAAVGEPVALEGTYCELLLGGRLDGNIVRDATADPRVRDLAITHNADVGAYIGVEVVLPDGELYGTFCCVSHEPDPALHARDVRFLQVFARLIADQLKREELEAQARRAEMTAANVGALLAALAARDGYTESHSQAVVDLALAIARHLGMSDDEVLDVENAALLHDIGKIGVPTEVLNKQGPLDDEEWSHIRRHPEIGEQIAGEAPFFAEISRFIRHHHERPDGRGYPDGLVGDRIPLASAI
ncbi:MAG TPA: HD domain-containing phosphohydrolase, partial [Solirubrobacteraceae bacterium]|nr:HD domain-containing phosphohydrolase [Solirubrobacteraceae bacterium]